MSAGTNTVSALLTRFDAGLSTYSSAPARSAPARGSRSARSSKIIASRKLRYGEKTVSAGGYANLTTNRQKS